MSRTLLLSVEALKKRSQISENVEVKVLTPIIEEMQDLHIHSIVGTALYEDLKSRVAAGSVASGNPVYTTLLDDYIVPCLVRYIESEVHEINTFKIANKGTQVKNSDNNQPASVSDMLALADNRKNKAEWYAQRVTDYLMANQTTYPKYQTQTRNDALYPNGTSYDSGLWLGDSGCDDCPPSREERWRDPR